MKYRKNANAGADFFTQNLADPSNAKTIDRCAVPGVNWNGSTLVGPWEFYFVFLCFGHMVIRIV